MLIEMSQLFVLDIPKGVYWIKMYLLTKNVFIEWKCTYVNKYGMVFVNQAPSKKLHFSLLQKYATTHGTISILSIKIYVQLWL